MPQEYDDQISGQEGFSQKLTAKRRSVGSLSHSSTIGVLARLTASLNEPPHAAGLATTATKIRNVIRAGFSQLLIATYVTIGTPRSVCP